MAEKAATSSLDGKMDPQSEGRDPLTCLPLILFLMQQSSPVSLELCSQMAPHSTWSAGSISCLGTLGASHVLAPAHSREDSLFALIIPKPLYLEENKIFIRDLWLW